MLKEFYFPIILSNNVFVATLNFKGLGSTAGFACIMLKNAVILREEIDVSNLVSNGLRDNFYCTILKGWSLALPCQIDPWVTILRNGIVDSIIKSEWCCPFRLVLYYSRSLGESKRYG